MKVLAHEIIKYFRIFIQLKKINFLTRLAFRFNFLLILLAVFFQVSINLFFIHVIFGWVKEIHGWNYNEVLLVISTAMIIDGIVWVSFAFVAILKNQIKMGLLDATLSKPIDGQFFVSVLRGDLEDVVRIITGVGLAIFALTQISENINLLIANIFWHIILTLNGVIIVYSLAVLVSCIAFWSIDGGSSFNFSNAISTASQYPTDIFGNGVVKGIFYSVIPIAFIATVPAKILSRGFEWKLVAGSFLTAVIFFWLSRKFWKRGLKKYSSASS